MPYTDEQKKIIRDINRSKNVRVIAVAGSGKTSTIIGTYPEHDHTLVLCYNNRLQADTQARIPDQPSSKRFDVFTFHGLCMKIFDEKLATTDIGIIRVNEMLSSPSAVLPEMARRRLLGKKRYRRIIVDEAQDLTPEYYTLITHLLRLTGASLTILGDPRQAIYQFNGADHKYLLNAAEMFDRTFVDRKLSISFRVPKSISDFVNAATHVTHTESPEMFPKIVPVTKGIKPMIYLDDVFDKFGKILDMLKRVDPNDVMILMYSTRRDASRTSVYIANLLIESGIPVDFNGVNRNGRGVLMISYHQSKGLERPIVICLDLGGYYFGLNPDVRRDCLPNLWYVAMTRASRFLIAFVDTPMEFIVNGMSAIGYTPPSPESPIIDSGRGHSKMDFERMIKYSPTSTLLDMMTPRRLNMSGAKWSGDRSLTFDGEYASDLTIKYIRKKIIDAAVDAGEFLREYQRGILGGLRGVSLNIGKISCCGIDMSLADGMNYAYTAVIGMLNAADVAPCKHIIGDYGNKELSTDDGTAVIIIAGEDIEAHIRFASLKKIRTMVCDIKNMMWLLEDETVESVVVE